MNEEKSKTAVKPKVIHKQKYKIVLITETSIICEGKNGLTHIDKSKFKDLKIGDFISI